MEEIIDKLERISRLLREIEDIICEQKKYDSELPVKTVTCACTCTQKSDSGKSAVAQSDKMVKNAVGKIIENVCPENCAKREESGRERMSARAGELSCSSSGKNNVVKKHEKDEFKVSRDVSCNDRSKRLKNDNAPRQCAHEQFVRRINDINEKCMSYFEDANRSN